MTFNSDNISTIAILRDVVAREASKRKIKVEVTTDIDDSSVEHTLRLLHPKLEYQLDLAKRVHLSDALKELAAIEDDLSFLSEEFMDVITRSDQLQLEHRDQKAHLERLYGVVYDLFVDRHKFRGISVRHKLPALMSVLDDYSLESLIAFFDDACAAATTE